MAEAFPTNNGGDGDYGDSKTSQFHKEASDAMKEMIHEAVVQKLTLVSPSSTVAIADLGCSVGPNTFSTVRNLIQAVENKLILQGKDPKNAKFHVFFNDLTANDFNTLFASLPADRPYYAAAAPGSFYGRLFPRASISVAYSSYSLQWLSKQPEVANEGRIHYSGGSADVLRAYSDQFERDMEVFMSARAEEMVRGGLMFLITTGAPDGASRSDLVAPSLLKFLGKTLIELANEGIVDKAKIDAFNLPNYDPTVGEMRNAIEKNGCFSIERMELTNPRAQMGAIDVASLMTHFRAGTEGILTAYFGTCVVEKLFTNFAAKAQEISVLLESAQPTSTQLFVVLNRK